MKAYEKLLLANKAWSKEKTDRDPTFFKELSRDQKPEFLWIGCSDSRVPAEEITGTEPGQVFVHRNVANLVVQSDFNFLSVLQYAVQALKVKHIIVCGHYGCGGIRAALSRKDYDLLNKWIYFIKTTYHVHEHEFEGLDEEQKVSKLVEINVREQVRRLSRTAIIQKAWQQEQGPSLHGWVFNLEDGLLKEQMTMEPGSEIPEIFRFKF